MEAGDAMGRKRDGLADGVDEPSEDDFTCSPTAVAFLELLDRNRFLAALTVGWGQRSEDGVDCREEDAAKTLAAQGATLGDTNGIVDKDVETAQRGGGETPAASAPARGLRDRVPVMGGDGLKAGILRGWWSVSETVEMVWLRIAGADGLVCEVNRSFRSGTEVGG